MICNVLTGIRTICSVNTDRNIMAEDASCERNSPFRRVKADNVDWCVVGNCQRDQSFRKGTTLFIVLLVGPAFPFIRPHLKVKGDIVRIHLHQSPPHFYHGIGFLRPKPTLFDSDRQLHSEVRSPQNVAMGNFRIMVFQYILQTLARNLQRLTGWQLRQYIHCYFL